MDNVTTIKNVNEDAQIKKDVTVNSNVVELNMKDALKELEYMKQHPEKYYRYTNWNDLEKSLLSNIKDENNI